MTVITNIRHTKTHTQIPALTSFLPPFHHFLFFQLVFHSLTLPFLLSSSPSPHLVSLTSFPSSPPSLTLLLSCHHNTFHSPPSPSSVTSLHHPSNPLSLSCPSFILFLLPPCSFHPPLSPSLCCSFTLSTLVVPIMQMSVCGEALKSRLGPGSLLIVTWLFHRGQQEGGISSCMCVCVCV